MNFPSCDRVLQCILQVGYPPEIFRTIIVTVCIYMVVDAWKTICYNFDIVYFHGYFRMHLKDRHIKFTDLLDLNRNCTVYCTDLNHNLLDFNDYLMTILNSLGFKSKDEVINKHVLSVLPHLTPAIEENSLIISTGKAHQFFNKVIYKNSFILFVTIKMPTYDENEKINGVFGVSQVISSSPFTHAKHSELSERERECVLHLIKGKTTAQIAEILNLSSRTVESYIENVKNKLGCTTKSMLIDKVLNFGIANFDKDVISTEFNPGIFMPSKDES